jgi:hypothetical protein
MKKPPESDKDRILKEFMLENFSYDWLREIKFFDKTTKRKDYKKQAELLCKFFGYKTIFEYGTREIRAHLTFADPDCPLGIGTYRPLHVDKEGELKPEPFVTVIPSWLDK